MEEFPGKTNTYIIQLVRRKKVMKCSHCGGKSKSHYDKKSRLVRDLPSGQSNIILRVEVHRLSCKECRKVKIESLEWLSKNTNFTKRFMLLIGRRCHESSVKSVAEDYQMDWKTVKELEKEYMNLQLKKAGAVNPRVIGVDEISVRKGHAYRIVVSDLELGRPIWFGGKDRTEESMDLFYAWLGSRKSKKIELGVMDMWKPFRKSLQKHSPKARILFDKFHVITHLNDALDDVRRKEYSRLAGDERSYIKGQRYTLLSNKENLDLTGRQSLKKLLQLNKRINTAYLLKESFSQLWSYRNKACARKFFKEWRDSLKWQRLPQYEKFAKMIDKHWEGIESYCDPQNKVPLGFVEGLNNKIRVIQRRAYGLRDEEYLKLKVLTCKLPLIKM